MPRCDTPNMKETNGAFDLPTGLSPEMEKRLKKIFDKMNDPAFIAAVKKVADICMKQNPALN